MGQRSINKEILNKPVERGEMFQEKSPTKTPEFKNRFGDYEATPEKASKVVDEEGKPKVVFHG
jgi:hypothetical protein